MQYNKNIFCVYNKNEIDRYSNILFNLSYHIDSCYSNSIISITEKIKYQGVIEIINNELQIVYNAKQKNISETSNSISLDTIYNYELMDVHIINNQTFNYFDDIKQSIIKLSCEIGFKNLHDLFNLVCGYNYIKNISCGYDDYYEKIKLYNKIFIPMTFKKIKYDEKLYDIECTLINPKYEALLNNYYEITVSYPLVNYKLIIEGYFTNDSLNIIIKSSEENSLINKKRDIIIKALNKNKTIPNYFKESFINNLSINDILVNNENTIVTNVNKIYKQYNKLSRLTFRNLINDFTNQNNTIIDQFNIIKIFLIGNTINNINIACLLYGLTKDKKTGSVIIQNIIFNNLNVQQQHKIIQNVTTLKKEIEIIKNISINEIDIKTQIIINKAMPDNVKKLIFEKIDEMKNNNTDYHKQKTYVDILANYPWNYDSDNDIFKQMQGCSETSVNFLNNMKKVLDENIYGHDECKTTMAELIGKWISNPKSSGKSIGIYGAYGVGKTLIAKSLGKVLNIPCKQINLGGLDDRCYLSGHSYTYNASQPGLLLRKIVEAGTQRCVIYFDELDKTCEKNGINEISNILIHITDPNANTEFSDSFFSELTFDISKILFVFSYNDPNKVDKILLDRMEQIEVLPYTTHDKILIVKNFLIKEICENIGMDHNIIKIDETNIEYIIENYTCEAGVRDIKRKLDKIFLKLNLDKIYNKNIFRNMIDNKIIITKEMIDSYLNKQISTIKQIHKTDSIGVINGLYATNFGYGGIVPICVYNSYTGIKNNMTLTITGSQGRVMQESVSFAFTIAMNMIKDEYRKIFIDSCVFGLHIHTPDGATSKDGPSAGSAFVIAFVSIILSKKIKHDIGITGEIDINGKITEIGGLEYKLKGAYNSGIKKVFVPEENKKDIDKILEKDEKIKNNLTIVIVNNIIDVIKDVLMEDDNKEFDCNSYFKNIK